MFQSKNYFYLSATRNVTRQTEFHQQSSNILLVIAKTIQKCNTLGLFPTVKQMNIESDQCSFAGRLKGFCQFMSVCVYLLLQLPSRITTDERLVTEYFLSFCLLDEYDNTMYNQFNCFPCLGTDPLNPYNEDFQKAYGSEVPNIPTDFQWEFST